MHLQQDAEGVNVMSSVRVPFYGCCDCESSSTVGSSLGVLDVVGGRGFEPAVLNAETAATAGIPCPVPASSC